MSATERQTDSEWSGRAGWRVRWCGDAALVVECNADFDPRVNARAVEIARQVRLARVEGV